MQSIDRMVRRRAAAQLALAVLAICGTLQAAEASAGPPIDRAASATVRYADLDLSSPAAVAVLYRRIEAAARRVCRASVNYRYLQSAPARHDCFRLTVDDAVGRANLATLTAMHLGSGRPAE